MSFDVNTVRDEFPILSQKVHSKPLVYLDSAASTQKPRCVIDAVRSYYENSNANVHRGAHALSERATKLFEDGRTAVKTFINAKENAEIIFVRGTTEAINLVAQSYGRSQLSAGDEIIVSELEHHSNIVPWQMLCEQMGAVLKVAPINEKGELDFKKYLSLLNNKTRIVAMAHVSNALGTILPIKEITAAAHRVGAVVVVDGAQAVAHEDVDVQELGVDFYAFSGHKMYGPTGIGVLYGKRELLEAMPPYQGGGDMISSVTFEKTTFAKLPYKFEAGTPNIAGVVGLAAAIEFLSEIGPKNIGEHERKLSQAAREKLKAMPNVRIIGEASERAGLVSFVLENAHPHDISSILDRQGVAIRAGHLCAQPVMKHFGVPALARASFAVHNTMEDVDALIASLQRVSQVF